MLTHVNLFERNIYSLGAGANAICSHEAIEEGAAQIVLNGDENAYATEMSYAA